MKDIDLFRAEWAKANIVLTIGPVGAHDGMRWFVQTAWIQDRCLGAGWYGNTWEAAVDKAIRSTETVLCENPS